MGQCGCGDFYATHKLAGPNNAVYAIQVYPGCDDCDTGVAVVISRFSESEAKNWGVPALPDLPFSKFSDGRDYDGQQSWIPIWHPRKLASALWERIADPLTRLFKKDKALSDTFPEGAELERMVNDNFSETRMQAKKGGWA